MAIYPGQPHLLIEHHTST